MTGKVFIFWQQKLQAIPRLKNVLASVTMSSMKNLRGEQGSMNVLLVPVILLAVLFVAAASFAVWAFGGRQDYKNNSDAKVAVAVTANKQMVQAADAKQYAEAAKNPLKLYSGSDAYGGVKVSYPKTWGAYIDTSNSSTPLDGYFHADYVPATQTLGMTYNLRVQVVAMSYSSVLSQFSPFIQTKKVTAAPYKLPKVPSVTGTMLTGAITSGPSNANGIMVLLPMRDKTLKVWTESPAYATDLNTYILPNLTFSP